MDLFAPAGSLSEGVLAFEAHNPRPFNSNGPVILAQWAYKWGLERLAHRALGHCLHGPSPTKPSSPLRIVYLISHRRRSPIATAPPRRVHRRSDGAGLHLAALRWSSGTYLHDSTDSPSLLICFSFGIFFHILFRGGYFYPVSTSNKIYVAF